MCFLIHKWREYKHNGKLYRICKKCGKLQEEYEDSEGCYGWMTIDEDPNDTWELKFVKHSYRSNRWTVKFYKNTELSYSFIFEIPSISETQGQRDSFPEYVKESVIREALISKNASKQQIKKWVYFVEHYEYKATTKDIPRIAICLSNEPGSDSEWIYWKSAVGHFAANIKDPSVIYHKCDWRGEWDRETDAHAFHSLEHNAGDLLKSERTRMGYEESETKDASPRNPAKDNYECSHDWKEYYIAGEEDSRTCKKCGQVEHSSGREGFEDYWTYKTGTKEKSMNIEEIRLKLTSCKFFESNDWGYWKSLASNEVHKAHLKTMDHYK